MFKLLLVAIILSSHCFCIADLNILDSRALMVGNWKWKPTSAPTLSGVKWEKAWMTSTSDRMVCSVYRGTTAKPHSIAELKKLLGHIMKAQFFQGRVKTVSASESVGKGDPVDNVGGTYLIKLGDQYARIILGLAQSKRTLIMVGTIFHPNDRVSGVQAAKLMESFRFDGKKIFEIKLKER